MRELLLSVGYNYWILPALLILPLLGAALVLLGGRASADGEDEVESGAAVAPRRLATIVFAVEFLLSLGLLAAGGVLYVVRKPSTIPAPEPAEAAPRG